MGAGQAADGDDSHGLCHFRAVPRPIAMVAMARIVVRARRQEWGAEGPACLDQRLPLSTPSSRSWFT